MVVVYKYIYLHVFLNLDRAHLDCLSVLQRRLKIYTPFPFKSIDNWQQLQSIKEEF